ncbi:MAG: hypothetical protein AB7S70_02570 [Hyphomicrobium sp.]|uniref:hypothetical protein n=1 Tax=Hyphomicrobium sp. TaxID=82 RepID=UPI003D14D34F
MKLTDKIKEMRRLATLLMARSAAVKAIRDIDEEGAAELGVDGGHHLTGFAEGEPGFVTLRQAVLERIGWLNDRIRALGYEIDLSDTETGEEGDDAPDEDAEADLGDEVPK